VPWVELSFGWLEDLIGPLLLKRANRRALAPGEIQGK
jgi:hypothetical protein